MTPARPQHDPSMTSSRRQNGAEHLMQLCTVFFSRRKTVEGLDEIIRNLRDVGKASQGAVVQLHKGTERLKTLDPAFHHISLLQASHNSDPGLGNSILHRLTPAPEQLSALACAILQSQARIVTVIQVLQQIQWHSQDLQAHATRSLPFIRKPKGSGSPVASHTHNPAFHQLPNREGAIDQVLQIVLEFEEDRADQDKADGNAGRNTAQQGRAGQGRADTGRTRIQRVGDGRRGREKRGRVEICQSSKADGLVVLWKRQHQVLLGA
ncbi:MAG: hypothetical protein FRX49_08185 [Trebouxia sp. A1-2]|nr:MAG: hypothetical protein FRX49_08185 [Trebouxia sp. A1-2]